VAICNEAGQPCNSFRQGDLAVFYYEFELTENIGVPICGIVISNDRGIIVFGKNSWQYDNDDSACLMPASKVVCRQKVCLNLGPGEYVFEVGLASVSIPEWKNREYISFEQISSCFIRICHIADAGFFSIGLAVKNGISVLTHHGIANLPGTLKMSAIARNSG